MTYDFSKITEVTLGKGSHDTPEQGMCAMEMVAWFEGEPHSDHPKCTCPILAAYVRAINDRMPGEERNALLKPMLPKLVGTVSKQHEQARAEALTWFVIKNQVPGALKAIGLHEHAKALLEADTLSAAEAAARAAEAAAEAAEAAAEAAAWAARAAAEAAEAAAGAAAWAAGAAEAAAEAAARAAGAADWSLAVQALEEAIELGPTGEFSLSPAKRHHDLKELAPA